MIIREVFYVPADFRYGIIIVSPTSFLIPCFIAHTTRPDSEIEIEKLILTKVIVWDILLALQASTFSNWGNLPTAVVQTIATQDPFDPKRDPTLGVAYVSVFMLIVSPSSVQIADLPGSIR